MIGANQFQEETSINKDRNPIFIFKCPHPFTSVRLQQCVNTEFDLEVNWGFEKASVSRAVRLRVSVSGELTV